MPSVGGWTAPDMPTGIESSTRWRATTVDAQVMSSDVRGIEGLGTGMTMDHALAQPLVRDELQTVVSMLCARFPECSQVDVEWLVTDVYRRLSENARIHAHLIPLTLNRCRQVLFEHRLTVLKGHDGSDFRPHVVAVPRLGVSLTGCAAGACRGQLQVHR